MESRLTAVGVGLGKEVEDWAKREKTNGHGQQRSDCSEGGGQR